MSQYKYITTSASLMESKTIEPQASSGIKSFLQTIPHKRTMGRVGGQSVVLVSNVPHLTQFFQMNCGAAVGQSGSEHEQGELWFFNLEQGHVEAVGERSEGLLPHCRGIDVTSCSTFAINTDLYGDVKLAIRDVTGRRFLGEGILGLHGGLVELPTGKRILFLGLSGAGKSYLMGELNRSAGLRTLWEDWGYADLIGQQLINGRERSLHVKADVAGEGAFERFPHELIGGKLNNGRFMVPRSEIESEWGSINGLPSVVLVLRSDGEPSLSDVPLNEPLRIHQAVAELTRPKGFERSMGDQYERTLCDFIAQCPKFSILRNNPSVSIPTKFLNTLTNV